MRILYTESSPGWGGQERRIIVEAVEMQRRGHQVLMGLRRGAGIVEPARAAGLEVIEIDFGRKPSLKALMQLLALIRHKNIELISTHSSADSWCSGLAARLLGRRVVRTRHLSTPIRGGINSRVLYNALADQVVTTCQSVVEPIRRQARLSAQRCRSVPTGVDPEQLRVTSEQAARWRTQHGISPDTWLIGTVCVLRDWKGISDLLRAANLLRDEPHIRWVVVGEGVNGHEFLKEHRTLGLEKQVLFTGAIDPPFEAMAAMDTFCLLSTGHEGVSQALLQAAYLGRPLIATRVGGSPEVCLEGETGLLVDANAATQVAEAAMWLAAHRDEARAMGRIGHELVANRFTRQIMADQMEQVFTASLAQ